MFYNILFYKYVFKLAEYKALISCQPGFIGTHYSDLNRTLYHTPCPA